MRPRESCCPPRWRERITGKLGACPRCMRASLLLTLVAWAAFALVQAVGPEPLPMVVTSVLAATSTLLLVAHIGAFFVRAARASRSGGFVVYAGPLEDHFKSRRRFLVGATALLGGLLLAPLFRLFGSEVVAQQSPPCNCTAPAPQPPAPKNCPSCACQTPGDPKMPNAQDCNAAAEGTTAVTSVNGRCKGTLAGCAGACTRTQTWVCAKKGAGFGWQEQGGSTDDCPTPPAPIREPTNSQGKCQGKGCRQPGADCEKETEWECDVRKLGAVGDWKVRRGPTTTKECEV